MIDLLQHPCVSIDFDRWVEEFLAEDETTYEDSTDVDGMVLCIVLTIRQE